MVTLRPNAYKRVREESPAIVRIASRLLKLAGITPESVELGTGSNDFFRILSESRNDTCVSISLYR